eukprot:scaffold1467_cov147-Skeletonema_menzelii.AAC.3
MQPPNNQFHQHPNGIMTAPRPGRFANRFGSDVENNNGGLNNAHVQNLFSPNVGGGNASATIAPPLLPQSNGKIMNHYQQQQQQQQQQQLAFQNEENLLNATSSSSYTPMKSQYGHAALAPYTPEQRGTPRKTIATPSGLRESSATPSQQQQPCGLSAVISLETSYRTPSKSTKTKKHRRNPSSVSRLFPTPTSASATPMRMTPATTTKKHKRSTSSTFFVLSTPTRTNNAATPMRTGTANKNNNNVTNTPDLDRGIKRDFIWTLPNTDTKVITSKPSHRRTPSRFQLTPQKNVFEAEDFSSSSSSSSDEQGNGGLKMDVEDNEDESIVVLPLAAAAAPPSATPNKKLRRTIPLPSPNLPGLPSARKKLKKQMTPPRQGYYSSHAVDTTSTPDEMGLLRTGFEGLEMYRMTSTELDPSDFQIQLPTKKEVLVHAKICNLMNGYTATQRDFNFAMLSGITRSTLEKEYEKSTNDDPMIAGICHKDVVKQVLECADDLVVEGFFREYGKEESSGGGGGERIEAGSTAAQARPVKSNLFGREGEWPRHLVPILTSFRSAYFSTSLEKALSFLLANLATRKPFFDVVMTGHSFGGAMATIASLRYAMDNSQMRVLCHTFGCPRVGGEEWRQLVHSVPNLRLFRVEKAHDSFVNIPTGNEWVHCGHSIQFSDDASQGENVQFRAHRFDRSAPHVSLSHTLQKVATDPGRVLKSVQSVATEPGKVLRSVQSKVVNIPIQGSSNGKDAIKSYVDKLSSSGDNWVTEFSGMKGKGVSGHDNEMRTLA